MSSSSSSPAEVADDESQASEKEKFTISTLSPPLVPPKLAQVILCDLVECCSDKVFDNWDDGKKRWENWLALDYFRKLMDCNEANHGSDALTKERNDARLRYQMADVAISFLHFNAYDISNPTTNDQRKSGERVPLRPLVQWRTHDWGDFCNHWQIIEKEVKKCWKTKKSKIIGESRHCHQRKPMDMFDEACDNDKIIQQCFPVLRSSNSYLGELRHALRQWQQRSQNSRKPINFSLAEHEEFREALNEVKDRNTRKFLGEFFCNDDDGNDKKAKNEDAESTAGGLSQGDFLLQKDPARFIKLQNLVAETIRSWYRVLFQTGSQQSALSRLGYGVSNEEAGKFEKTLISRTGTGEDDIESSDEEDEQHNRRESHASFANQAIDYQGRYKRPSRKQQQRYNHRNSSVGAFLVDDDEDNDDIESYDGSNCQDRDRQNYAVKRHQQQPPAVLEMRQASRDLRQSARDPLEESYKSANLAASARQRHHAKNRKINVDDGDTAEDGLEEPQERDESQLKRKREEVQQHDEEDGKNQYAKKKSARSLAFDDSDTEDEQNCEHEVSSVRLSALPSKQSSAKYHDLHSSCSSSDEASFSGRGRAQQQRRLNVTHRLDSSRRGSGVSNTGKPPPRKRRFFTEDEKNAIKDGVKRHGEGNWTAIKADYPEILRNRTNVQIKDKWRTMKENREV